MAEYGRRRRALRRMWSLLSVAGTTVGVAATASGSVPGIHEPMAAAYRQGRSSASREVATAPVGPAASTAASTAAAPDSSPSGFAAPPATGPTPAVPGAGAVPAVPALTTAPPATVPPPAASTPGPAGAPMAPDGSSGATTSTIAAGGDGVVVDAAAADGSLAWYEAVGQAALARLTYPWRDRLPGWTVRFLPGRPGLLGGTWTYEQRIEIYVRDGQDVTDVAFTLAHELGHAVDVGLLSDADRQRWIAARSIPASVPWWVDSGATDFSSGSGDWAEAFAVWQVGGVSHSRVAAAPSAGDLAVVAQLSRPGG